MTKHPVKPASRPDGVGIFQRIKLFRQDIFASQPAKLYKAWMAETRTPFYRSFLINQPDLVKRVLKERPEDFPKSPVIHDTLKHLLGDSVFVTNGEQWKRQRRIIDPAFEGGRLHEAFPAMRAAGLAAMARLGDGGEVEMEYQTAHLTADVIFRTLFSMPIEDDTATKVFQAFRDYQRTQPLWNVAGLLQLPRWVPRFRSKKSAQAAGDIRGLLEGLVTTRQAEIAAGTAPNDLATKIMTKSDPETGHKFGAQEMVDQVAIFFLAGHETSASALSWALYLLAFDPEVQERLAAEVAGLDMENIQFKDLSKLRFTRAVFRETLRLYPPVPMMVRRAEKDEQMRDRKVPKGSMVILSPWHLHRHERLWDRPDEFDPDRWETENGKQCGREAYIPFSAGARVCTGAGFGMAEGVLLLAMLVQKFRFEIVREPTPVAYLTVRAKDGIWLRLVPRVVDAAQKKDDLLVQNYYLFLKQRMAEKKETVLALFDKIARDENLEDGRSYHIEIFPEEPDFTFSLFGRDEHGVDTWHSPAMEEFQRGVSDVWPLITPDEFDTFLIWEDDAEWGRQVALKQPLDSIDISGLCIAWFRDILRECRSLSQSQVTISVHDSGHTVTL